MNLTKEIVLSMGFVEATNSKNPTFYTYSVEWGDSKIVIACEEDGCWSLYNDWGQTREWIQYISSVEQLVSLMISFYFNDGRRYKTQ